jgi:hypothetical protein
MERGWIDTVMLLGLDVMLAAIATLAALSAVARVLQLRRNRMSSGEARNDLRSEPSYEPPVAGYAPSLSMGLTPYAAAMPERRAPDWLARWMRHNPGPDEFARPAPAAAVARREHEVA